MIAELSWEASPWLLTPRGESECPFAWGPLPPCCGPPHLKLVQDTCEEADSVQMVRVGEAVGEVSEHGS